MEKQDIRPIGEYIAELRKKNEYSQAELAKKLFLTPQAISALERNSSNLSLELAVAICKEFDISLSAFHERSLESDGFAPIPSEEELAKRLIGLRKTKGLNRKTVAEQTGLSERTIRNYENGAASPSFQFLEKAADIYGVSFKELFAVPKKKKPFIVPVWVWWVIGVTVAAGSAGGVTALVIGTQNKKSPTPTPSTTSLIPNSEGGSGGAMSSESSSSQGQSTSAWPISQTSFDSVPSGTVHYDVAAHVSEFQVPWDGGYISTSYTEVWGYIDELYLYSNQGAQNACKQTGGEWPQETLIIRGERQSEANGGAFVNNFVEFIAPAPIHGASITFQGWGKDKYWVSLEYAEDGVNWTPDPSEGFGRLVPTDGDPDSSTHTISFTQEINTAYIRFVVGVHPDATGGSGVMYSRVGVWSIDLDYD